MVQENLREEDENESKLQKIFFVKKKRKKIILHQDNVFHLYIDLLLYSFVNMEFVLGKFLLMLDKLKAKMID
jgi:hypothetical protein